VNALDVQTIVQHVLMNVLVHVVVILAHLHVEQNARISVGVVQDVMQHVKTDVRIHVPDAIVLVKDSVRYLQPNVLLQLKKQNWKKNIIA
jgi:hypothetical protein